MTRSFRILLPAAAAALLVAACGGDEGGWQGTVTDSAGVQIVNNTGAGLWGPDEAWTLEQDLVIGTAEGDPAYQFGQIAGLDIGDDGRVYVTDQQAQQVRIFGADGTFQSTLGQPGSGPGELSANVGQVFVTPGDTVLVPDLGLQRLARYGPSGETLESTPLPLAGGIPVKWMEAPDHSLLQQAMVMQLPGQEEVEQKNLLLRRNTHGEVVDTVMEMPMGGTVSFAGGQPSFRIFESEPMWTVGPDGALYFGINSEYRIEALSPDGELIRVVQKPGERKPITESDQAEYRRVIRDAWQRQGMNAQAMEMMSQALSFAEYYPAYANILGGPEGSLWVQEIQTPDAVAEGGGTFNLQDIGGPGWQVYDDQGRLLGTVTMPPRFTPVVFIGDRIYGVLRDELDVQYVARMTLDRGAPPIGE
ncbi:MAG: 6-bladed beta-propeller [Gemmatimonadota bacterium]|jgi:hypothetical protein